tara:strand:+ start:449 stop:1420 length:972 start_codon:yes stop_codon:yes gene_type:complete
MFQKKIVITGGLGLIGKELIEFLNKDNYEIIVIDLKGQIKRYKKYINSNRNIKFIACDINSPKLLNITKNCHTMIHLAAMLGVKNTESNKSKCWKINSIGTQNILKACKKNKINRLIFSSSSEVYGEQTQKKINENHPLLGKNIYAKSKIFSENLIKSYKTKNKKFKYCNLRLFNTYGRGQVAKFFISKSCYNSKKNKKIILNGDGNQLRGYCYASDTAHYIYLCLKNFKKIQNLTLNVGNSKEVYSLKSIVKIIERINKKKIKYVFNPKFKNTDRNSSREIFNRICDTKKIISLLKFKPKVKIYNGISKVLSQNNIFSNWPN